MSRYKQLRAEDIPPVRYTMSAKEFFFWLGLAAIITAVPVVTDYMLVNCNPELFSEGE